MNTDLIFRCSTLFVQDDSRQFEAAPAYAPATRRASRPSFHQNPPSQFASASTYAVPARRASRPSFAQDNPRQSASAPTYATPARRASRPLSRGSQSQSLRSPRRPVSNLALPGGRPVTSSFRPPSERRDTLRSMQQIPPSRRRSSSVRRHRQSIHSLPQNLQSPKRSPARTRQSDGFDSLFDDINEVEEEFDDDDGGSLFDGDF